ncbi:MAG: hypothetical protein K2O00_02675 [Muribaculaceae bacterium]|nr:hypothetical protein [Muribaculaceae bacterium]
MNKQGILKILKEKTCNNNLKFPTSIDIESNDGILQITLSESGLKDNMQEDKSAFEGWAIVIKAIAPDHAKQVKILWRGIGLGKGNDYNHYRRFLYRIIKFKESYEWAEGNPLDDQAKHDMENVYSEINQKKWVTNYPDSNSKEDAAKGEARLERNLIECLRKISEYANHQLPVGLFYKDKCVKNERTPHKCSQIDLWSIKGDTITVYELKKDDNRKVGIISELMFYTNIIKDLSTKIISFASGAEKTNYRNFSALHNIITSANCNIEGVFLTNDLHTLIKLGGANIFALLNGNNRDIKYKQMGYKISDIYEVES